MPGPLTSLDLSNTRRPARGRLEHLVERSQAPAITRSRSSKRPRILDLAR